MEMTTESPPVLAGLVGVGASAGGLESLRLLLAQLPVDSGLCFVLLQHMTPTHRSVLAEILRPIPFKVPAREPVSWGNEEATGERDLGSGD